MHSSICPRRKGLLRVSQITIPTCFPLNFRILPESSRADLSGSWGRSAYMLFPFTLDLSMPPLRQVVPVRVVTIKASPSARNTLEDSLRTISTNSGLFPVFFAILTALADGLILSMSTILPSVLETAFCPTTTTSRFLIPTPNSLARSIISAARSSSLFSRGNPSSAAISSIIVLDSIRHSHGIQTSRELLQYEDIATQSNFILERPNLSTAG